EAKRQEAQQAAIAKEADRVAIKTEFTPEEEAEIKENIRLVDEQDNRVFRKLDRLKNSWLMRKFFSQNKTKEIDSFGKALTHFLMGYSTWNNTNKFFGKVWNPFFLARNFWHRPRAWITMLAYPNYFKVSVGNEERASARPSIYNGGERTIFETKLA